jgi:hypothetical protein
MNVHGESLTACGLRCLERARARASSFEANASFPTAASGALQRARRATAIASSMLAMLDDEGIADVLYALGVDASGAAVIVGVLITRRGARSRVASSLLRRVAVRLSIALARRSERARSAHERRDANEADARELRGPLALSRR